MKDCDYCRAPIPDNLLVCPVCVGAVNDQAVREMQYEYLRKIVARQHGYYFTLHNLKGVKHVQMFGYKVDVAFCGTPCDAPKTKRTYMEWGYEDSTPYLCVKCRIELKSMVREALETQPERST